MFRIGRVFSSVRRDQLIRSAILLVLVLVLVLVLEKIH
jgi:hypothetical protein